MPAGEVRRSVERSRMRFRSGSGRGQGRRRLVHGRALVGVVAGGVDRNVVRIARVMGDPAVVTDRGGGGVEEGRGGEKGRSRGGPEHLKKNKAGPVGGRVKPD